MVKTRQRPAATIMMALALSVMATMALAQAPGRVRGTITSVDAGGIAVRPNAGGPDLAITLSPTASVTALLPGRLSDIAKGSFVGTAAETQPDGTLVAREVHVFPESMRGAGEGHRPFDLGPKSTMTNGAVGQEVEAQAGDTLTVTYKGGEKTIVVPKDVPVVLIAPGDRAMLVPGAHVTFQAEAGTGGALLVSRITVGKDGLVPPM